MHFTHVTGAAVLLALAPTALSAGTARVVNNCNFPVYYASVAQNVGAPLIQLPASGYSEPFSKPNVGVSIKISPNASGPVTQFEYTWADGKVNYDISNINGNPFSAGGMTLTPTMAGDSNNPSCETVSCPAGASTCTQAYNQPDDVRTMVCNENSDLIMTLCPGGSAKRDTEAQHGHGRVHARHLPKLV